MAAKTIIPIKASNIEQRLLRIANVLLINGRFTNSIGLLEGKMGIAIFFYNYARHTGNNIYNDYAGELIDDVFDEIHAGTPLNFSNGLCGIGWGIEYLIKNNFVIADADEILEETDNAILSARFQSSDLFRNSNELFGQGLYSIARLDDHKEDYFKLPHIKNSLTYLINECKKVLVHKRDINDQYPNINTETLISIIYFLLKMQKVRLFPTKVEKIFKYLLSNTNSIFPTEMSLIDNIAITGFIKEINQKKIVPVEQSQLFLDELTKQRAKITISTQSMILEELTKLSYYSLLYPIEFENYEIAGFISEASSIIGNEETWKQQVNSLNTEDMSLRNGFSGVGLGLLEYGLQKSDHKEISNNSILN